MKKTWPFALLLVVVVGAVWWLIGSHDRPSHKHRAHDAVAQTQPEPLPPPRVVKPIERANRPAKPTPVATQQDDKPSRPVHDKRVRDEVRAKIYEAFGRPVPQRDRLNPPGTMGSTVHLPGRLDKNYIKGLIKEDFKPLARTCYQEALERHPDLAGKLVVSFTIIGYEDIGGVVEGANVMKDESSLDDEQLDRCIEDAMLSMAFDAPKGGGSVRVRYPFDFSPERRDAGHGRDE